MHGWALGFGTTEYRMDFWFRSIGTSSATGINAKTVLGQECIAMIWHPVDYSIIANVHVEVNVL
jgi:hypothetical protein